VKASKEAIADVNRAKGQAEAQRLQRQTLTAELQKQAIEKWDGHFPTVMSGSGTLPLINIDSASLLPNSRNQNRSHLFNLPLSASNPGLDPLPPLFG